MFKYLRATYLLACFKSNMYIYICDYSEKELVLALTNNELLYLIRNHLEAGDNMGLYRYWDK